MGWETHKQCVPAGRALRLMLAVHLCQANSYIKLDLFFSDSYGYLQRHIWYSPINDFLAFWLSSCRKVSQHTPHPTRSPVNGSLQVKNFSEAG